MKPGNCCRRLSPFFYILINIPDTIPQQHLHSWLLPYWVLAWSSPGCTPALRWQLTCTAFHPYWVLQVESWAMSNDIAKATQLVRDRAGYQIQGFWGPDKCFLILNAGVYRGKNKSKVSLDGFLQLIWLAQFPGPAPEICLRYLSSFQKKEEPMVLWGGLSLNTVVYVTLWCM